MDKLNDEKRLVSPRVFLGLVVVFMFLLYGMIQFAVTSKQNSLLKEQPAFSAAYQNNQSMLAMSFTELAFTPTGQAIGKSTTCGDLDVTANIGPKSTQGTYFSWRLSDPERGEVSVFKPSLSLFGKEVGTQSFYSALAFVEKQCQENIHARAVAALNELSWMGEDLHTPPLTQNKNKTDLTIQPPEPGLLAIVTITTPTDTEGNTDHRSSEIQGVIDGGPFDGALVRGKRIDTYAYTEFTEMMLGDHIITIDARSTSPEYGVVINGDINTARWLRYMSLFIESANDTMGASLKQEEISAAHFTQSTPFPESYASMLRDPSNEMLRTLHKQNMDTSLHYLSTTAKAKFSESSPARHQMMIFKDTGS